MSIASSDPAVQIYLFLNCPSLVFLELRLKMTAPHFDAKLSSVPHVSHSSSHLGLVQGTKKVAHNLQEVLVGLLLDSPDLCLADTAQKKATWSFVGIPSRQRNLCVARDDLVLDRS